MTPRSEISGSSMTSGDVVLNLILLEFETFNENQSSAVLVRLLLACLMNQLKKRPFFNLTGNQIRHFTLRAEYDIMH